MVDGTIISVAYSNRPGIYEINVADIGIITPEKEYGKAIVHACSCK